MERLTKKQLETRAPLSDLLTLEELREMDGEPVWVERPGYGKHWALVQVWTKSSNIIYLTCSNGMVVHPQPEIDSGAKIYRRKPEISVQTVPLHDPPWKAHLRARFERLE